jgi:hypothetical protein
VLSGGCDAVQKSRGGAGGSGTHPAQISSCLKMIEEELEMRGGG